MSSVIGRCLGSRRLRVKCRQGNQQRDSADEPASLARLETREFVDELGRRGKRLQSGAHGLNCKRPLAKLRVHISQGEVRRNQRRVDENVERRHAEIAWLPRAECAHPRKKASTAFRSSCSSAVASKAAAAS